MAKRGRGRRRAGAKRLFPRVGKIVLLVLVLLLVAGAYAWHKGRSWRPDEAVWPDQGALVGAADGAVDFGTIAGLGAKFVYLEASDGLAVGATHRFDPCAVADGQSANFVTMVPRDSDLLPPVILLETTADQCPSRVSDAAVQSELTTLVNQIEAHSGKPAILAPVEEFEAAYAPSRRFDRQLWLTRSWVEPDYASRPWLMWTANRWYKTEAAQEPLRWVVVRP